MWNSSMAGVTAICELLARHSGMSAPRPDPAPVRALRGPGGVTPAGRGLRAGLDGGRRRARFSARSARRSSSPRSTARSAGCWATSAGSRCGPASGPAPRPASTGPGRAWSAWLSSWRRRLPASPGPASAPSHDELGHDELGHDEWPDELAGRDVLVVGAGSMSTLAATTASRGGAASIAVANRTWRHAERLADRVGGRAVALADLAACPGGRGYRRLLYGRGRPVITHELAAAALVRRNEARRPGSAGVPRPGHAARCGAGRRRPCPGPC